MIHITEHTKDLAVMHRESHGDRFTGGTWEMLKFLGREKSKIRKKGVVTRDGLFPQSIVEVHFVRCDGANNLYWKLLRACAEKHSPKAAVATHTAQALMLHEMFKSFFNDSKTTSDLKPSEFKVYYDHCQRRCIEVFGVSGMDEDDGEFDHGFEPVNPK